MRAIKSPNAEGSGIAEHALLVMYLVPMIFLKRQSDPVLTMLTGGIGLKREAKTMNVEIF